MTPPALQPAHDTISLDAVERLGPDLQMTLLELTDLALSGKHAHWNLVGPGFLALHLQLDELVDSWRELADEVAERAAAIGVVPDGRAAPVAAATPIDPLPAAPIAPRAAARALADGLDTVLPELRARVERAGELDAVSQDVLIDVVRTLEKQRWMLRAEAAMAPDGTTAA